MKVYPVTPGIWCVCAKPIMGALASRCHRCGNPIGCDPAPPREPIYDRVGRAIEKALADGPCPDCGLNPGFSPHAEQCTSDRARELEQGAFSVGRN